MEITNCINYLLTISQHDVFQNFSSGLSKYNVTPGQYGILNCIWTRNNDGITPTELAQILHLETTTISNMLDKMERVNLIERYLCSTNKRNVYVKATKLGMQLKDDIIKTIEFLNEETLKEFTPDEQKQFILYLKRLNHIDPSKESSSEYLTK